MVHSSITLRDVRHTECSSLFFSLCYISMQLTGTLPPPAKSPALSVCHLKLNRNLTLDFAPNKQLPVAAGHRVVRAMRMKYDNETNSAMKDTTGDGLVDDSPTDHCHKRHLCISQGQSLLMYKLNRVSSAIQYSVFHSVSKVTHAVDTSGI